MDYNYSIDELKWLETTAITALAKWKWTNYKPDNFSCFW